MKTVRDLSRLAAPPQRVVATLGNFDGVHLGHRAIFRRVVAEAGAIDGTATVVTFVPHPLKLLAPERAPLLINTYAERERLIAASRIDLLAALPFTRELAAMPAARFVEEILVGRLGLRHLVVGYDYAFGAGRVGNAAFLREQGERYGFTVEELSPIASDGGIYSSTRIRQLLLAGEVEAVVPWLGRHFTLEGRVVHGAGRGAGLGFPTANLQTDKELLPREGVYAVKVRHRGRIVDGVANLGRNPTFGEHELTVEVHLLDAHADLYGETLRLYFLKRLRDEKTFPTPAALVATIREDVATARAYLATERVVEYREYLSGSAGRKEGR